MSERQFLDHAAKYTVGVVGGVGAAAPVESMQPDYALAQQVAPDIVTETVEYDSPKGHGTVRGLLVRPAAAEAPLPAVLVIHENRGLNPISRTWRAGWARRATWRWRPMG